MGEQESMEEAEERAKVLGEVALLKQYAVFHLHPEKPVVSSDAMSSGRNYFTRASAPEQDSMEEAEERAKVLEEAALLKQYAEFHLHPEKPVASSDAMSSGRNYFTRASAPEQESMEEAEERASNANEHKIEEQSAEGITKQVNLQQAPHKHSTKDGNEVEEETMNRSPS